MQSKKNHTPEQVLETAAKSSAMLEFDDRLSRLLEEYRDEMELSEEDLSLVSAARKIPPLFNRRDT